MTDLADFAGGGFQTILTEGIWDLGNPGGSSSGILNVPFMDLSNTFVEVKWNIGNTLNTSLPAIGIKNASQLEWKSLVTISLNNSLRVHYRIIQDTSIKSIDRGMVTNSTYRNISSDPIGAPGFANQITVGSVDSSTAIVKCGLHTGSSTSSPFYQSWSANAEGWMLNNTTLLVPYHKNNGNRIVSYQILNY